MGAVNELHAKITCMAQGRARHRSVVRTRAVLTPVLSFLSFFAQKASSMPVPMGLPPAALASVPAPVVETAPACLRTSGALLNWPSLTVLILACICILVSVVADFAAPCVGHALRASPFPSRQIPPQQPWHSLPPPTRHSSCNCHPLPRRARRRRHHTCTSPATCPTRLRQRT